MKNTIKTLMTLGVAVTGSTCIFKIVITLLSSISIIDLVLSAGSVSENVSYVNIFYKTILRETRISPVIVKVFL